MNIKIYGTGCSKCQQLAKNVDAALAGADVSATVEKVTDIDKIVERGIVSTPTLEVDGKIVAAGRVISPEEIRRLLGMGCGCSKSGVVRGKGSWLRKLFGVILVIFALTALILPVVKDGGVSRRADEATPVKDGNTLIVYYFHGTQRCRTCNAIEKMARNVVETRFVKALSEKRIVFKSVNVDDQANEHFVSTYSLSMRTVVLARGKAFKRLDKVWQLVRDEKKFSEYLESEIKDMIDKEVAK